MATRPKRSEWHQTKEGKWARSFGGRGYRVRLFQKRKGGVFYRAIWTSGYGFSRASLETADRTEAEQIAKQALAELLSGTPTAVPSATAPAAPAALAAPVETGKKLVHVARKAVTASPASGVVTLKSLWDRYSRECAAFLDNHPHARADAESRVQVLKAVFGAHRDVRTITAIDLTQYTAKRRAGGIRCEGDRKTRPVRQGSVHWDFRTLRTMLRWARTVRTPDGVRWLDHDPLDGLRLEKEKNPARPVSSSDRYAKTRIAVQRLAASATFKRDRLRWLRIEFALFLANATGRRRGAIAGLRVDDFDFTANRLTWRAEFDKKGVEWIVPMPIDVMTEVRQFLTRLGVTSGFVFPSKRNPSGHVPPDMLGQWLLAAELEAKLPKLKRGLWHPYRRKWASERMHLPLKAVADAGGWKDVTTLMRCYQHADEALLLAVMTNQPTQHVAGAADGTGLIPV